jgi:hypothetical protein
LHSTISNDKIISSTAPHEEPDNEEDIIPSEFKPPAKSARRGSGGKTAGDWKLHVQFHLEDRSDLINYVKEELQSLIRTDISVAAHPNQKIKSNSPRKPEHGSFWHLKHPRTTATSRSAIASSSRCAPPPPSSPPPPPPKEPLLERGRCVLLCCVKCAAAAAATASIHARTHSRRRRPPMPVGSVTSSTAAAAAAASCDAQQEQHCCNNNSSTAATKSNASLRTHAAAAAAAAAVAAAVLRPLRAHWALSYAA